MLEKLSTGLIPAYLDQSDIDAKYKFGESNVLKVSSGRICIYLYICLFIYPPPSI